MKRKLLPMMMAALMLGSSLSVSAAEMQDVGADEITAGVSKSSDVFYDEASDFIVTIPKAIQLGSTKTADYNVSVRGSVRASESVSVEPAGTFAMHETEGRKSDVTASAVQVDTVWSCEQITAEGTSKAGSVAADGLTAGSWEGALTFYINMHDESAVALEAGLYDAEGVMLCTWEESGIDVSMDYGESEKYDNCYRDTASSGYYVLTNNYPTATKVVIPDSVTSIGDSAFHGCTSLTSVIIPNSVTSIGEQAFNGCTSLTNIIIPNGVTNVEGWTFMDCTSLTSVTIPSSVISIGVNAFYYCTSLASITIPDSVTSIGGGAFASCTSLTNVIISDSVTSIGDGAFSNTSWLSNKQAENPLVIINDILIDGQSAVGDIVIPDGVKVIAENAFYNNNNILSVIISDSVTNISNDAFNACFCLTNVTIGSGVTSIGSHAFDDCTKLTNITIPDSVTSIEAYAFVGDMCLTSVIFENPSNWYVGSSVDDKATALSESDLSDVSIAVTYLNSTYVSKYWTRSE